MLGMDKIDYGLIGFFVLLIFLFLMLVIAFLFRDRNWQTLSGSHLREITSFKKLTRSLNYAIEAGKGVHFTLGWASISSLHSATALIGLSMLKRITKLVAIGDEQTTVSSGDGSLLILSQDSMKNAYQSTPTLTATPTQTYNPLRGMFTGPSPFSYASGTLPLIYDHNYPSNILTGHFGVEVALIADASENTNTSVGSLHISQSVPIAIPVRVSAKREQ